ncbi:MAG: zinc-binding dehydrogenase [Candidatus Hodarchaeota archaeon]
MITLNDEQIPKLMNAVVLEKPFVLVNKEIPIWPIEEYNDPDLLLIKVKACGICGSDFRYYQGENPWAQHTLGQKIENPPNIVLGHEFSGIVVGVLDDLNRKWLGKRVIPICSKTCGKCTMCTTGRENLCESTIHMGHGQGWGKRDYYPGAYADYVIAWGKGCFEIPESVSFEEATTMDVLAVCLHVVNQGNIKKSEPVLILGCGPAGNGIAQIIKIIDPKIEIFIVEKSKTAIELAKHYSFDYIIDSNTKSEEEIKNFILKRTNGYGVNSIFDSIGTELSFNLGLSLLAKGGTYVNMAVHDEQISMNQMTLASERRITTSSNFLIKEYKKTLKWLGEKKFNVQPWLTEIKLSVVPEIFHKIVDKNKRGKYFKIIIKKD